MLADNRFLSAHGELIGSVRPYRSSRHIFATLGLNLTGSNRSAFVRVTPAPHGSKIVSPDFADHFPNIPLISRRDRFSPHTGYQSGLPVLLYFGNLLVGVTGSIAA